MSVVSPLYCVWDDSEVVEEDDFVDPFTARQFTHSCLRRRSHTRSIELAEEPLAIQRGCGQLVVGLDATDVTNLW